MTSRRTLLTAVVVGLAIVVSSAALGRANRSSPHPAVHADQRPGPVLLVPGYGGSTDSLEVLAQRLRTTGRDATVVPLPGDGTGDLRADAVALRTAADAALAAGAPSVDVVGYSAGGVVARLWAAGGGAAQARRIVTLGSPHHGTKVAGLAKLLASSACQTACRQLAPGSSLLDDLPETPDGPQWLSLWTSEDQTVTPPDSAHLDGADDLVIQDLCRGLSVSHDDLPLSPQVGAIVLAALSGPTLQVPADCPG